MEENIEYLLSEGRIFEEYIWDNEPDFEKEVIFHVREIFGEDSVYIDLKKRIGKNDILSIPDGYLIDFNFKDEPKLWIIENELQIHDPFSHIGRQLLKFASSYKLSDRRIKQLLLEFILRNSDIKSFIEEKIKLLGLRNLDYFLESIIFDKPVRAIIVINEISEALSNVIKELSMETQVLEFKTYVLKQDQFEPHIHKFTPFESELRQTKQSFPTRGDLEGIDTIIIAAYEQSLKETFLGENCWYYIRISESFLPKLKYIAAYVTSPISAITHYAEIAKIEYNKSYNKYKLFFKETPIKIGPIRYIPKSKGGKASHIQAPRYTVFEKLKMAKTLDDIF